MRAAIICYATREASAIGRYQIRSCRRSKHRGGHPCLRLALQRHAVTPTGRGSPMSLLVSVLFERELTRRGVSFSFDNESARYRIEHQGGRLLVSLDNLARAYNRDRDQSRIASFVDAMLGSRFESRPWPEAQPSILFALEPSDHVEPSDLRTPLSKQVDRVPVVYTLDASPRQSPGSPNRCSTAGTYRSPSLRQRRRPISRLRWPRQRWRTRILAECGSASSRPIWRARRP